MTESRSSTSTMTSSSFSSPRAVINTVNWDDAEAVKNIDWVRNMTNHIKYRYEDEGQKYEKKDENLFEIAWRSIACDDNDNDNGGFECSVIPLSKTNFEIQKKCKKVVNAHQSSWDSSFAILERSLADERPNFSKSQTTNDDGHDLVHQCLLLTHQGLLTRFSKLIKSIKKLLPKVNGKTVLDATPLKLGATAKQCGPVQYILIATLLYSIELKIMRIYKVIEVYDIVDLIADFNEILALCPRYDKSEAQCADEVLGFVIPNISDFRLQLIRVMYQVGNLDQISLATLRGIAAAIRLIFRDSRNINLRYDCNRYFPNLTIHILMKAVQDKILARKQRPFFSTKKLKKLENELGTGMYSGAQFKCNECSCSDCDDVTLKLCSGCCRV